MVGALTVLVEGRRPTVLGGLHCLLGIKPQNETLTHRLKAAAAAAAAAVAVVMGALVWVQTTGGGGRMIGRGRLVGAMHTIYIGEKGR